MELTRLAWSFCLQFLLDLLRINLVKAQTHSIAYFLSDDMEFRDLACYECSGPHCPVQRYTYPVGHLAIGCQSCYKEWKDEEPNATRKCFFPYNYTELIWYNSTEDMCGVLKRGHHLLFYCFCFTDYCNGTPAFNSKMPSSYVALLVTHCLAVLWTSRCQWIPDTLTSSAKPCGTRPIIEAPVT